MKKLPPIIYAEWFVDRDIEGHEPFLRTSEKADCLIRVGETKRLAVYRFEKFVDIANRTYEYPVSPKRKGTK